ncbi:E3 ubiquitin-protein ligase TRIM45-like, partial [Saccostrea echinata]|uniref:E3 ubiquitin-protein ligase TRIM45-like n=1 Tax=Saccostrea echinata TaxID=191078 RepID=UPI002A83F8A5
IQTMATPLKDIPIVEDVTLCSICFEKFKKPRYLPCSHSFCQSCLSSYIVSICASTEPRLGFNCPLCREYIPCKGTFDKPEELVNLFPVNNLLEKIIEKGDQLNCESCLRDNEEEEASAYCATCMENLCQVCTKCHKKGLVTKDHRLYLLSEIKSSSIVPESVSNLTCSNHKNREIELFCNDHEKLCCTMCVSTEHRKCESVDTVEIAASNLRESGKLGGLLNDVRNLEKKLIGSKARQEKNVTEIEDTVDDITEKAEKEFNTIVDHLEKLKNELLQDISVIGKQNKEKLRKSIEIVADGVQCSKSCGDKIERAIVKGGDVELLMEYYSARATQDQMNCFHFKEKNISILENRSELLKQIKDLKSLSQIETLEFEPDVFPGYEKELSLKREFSPSNVNICSGTFLSNGSFIVANHLSNGGCNIYDNGLTCIKTIAGLSDPFAAAEYGTELFITCLGTKSIKVFSSSDYSEKRSIKLNIDVYGITCRNGVFYLACGDKIIKIDSSGERLKEYKTGKRVVHLLGLNRVNLIYSNKEKHTVTAINEEGDALWEYKASNLKLPYGLERDSDDNIFVAGTESENIHILSYTGEAIRIFDCVQKPIFLAINKQMQVYYVCSEYKKIKVYELK